MAALVVATCAFAASYWFPWRAMSTQNHELAGARHELAVLNAENATLARQNSSLQSSSVIAQVARKAYGLVQPGQSLYVILPPAATVAGNGGQEAFAGDPGLQPLVAPNQAGVVEGGAGAMGATARHHGAAQPGLVSRVLRSLQFWR